MLQVLGKVIVDALDQSSDGRRFESHDDVGPRREDEIALRCYSNERMTGLPAALR